jgi:CheY-like chemotaxis protein
VDYSQGVSYGLRAGEWGKEVKQIPVVAVTGYGSDFEQYPDHAGFSGFITKPYHVSSLLRAISGYLERVPEKP